MCVSKIVNLGFITRLKAYIQREQLSPDRAGSVRKPSTSAQGIAVSQSRFHGGHGCESAGAAPSMFDRRSINLTAIDLFLRSKDREEVENIAERMCRRAEHKQGTKSFNLSNLKKDVGACGLPVDDSLGRS